ncbi:serine hydrolase domain-containing protein [Rubrobacter tropicus]|uniref:serine hydrolase domain-containing protein n=1 Tax=Rubrobacter tropicus TaxID=2653851 RepID=UPI001D183118|nr:serine hydrolase domain-containing protein [Rubrobacter tropicus]
MVFLSALVPFFGCGNDARDAPRFSDDVVRQLDDAVADQMRFNDLPGAVVGVWVPGEGRYVVAKGKANLETGEVRNVDDPFRIGSITKTFVATAVLRLVDEDEISKSDKLSRWYPDFPNADRITIDDLLSMRSGIAEASDIDILWDAYKEDRLAGISTGEVIERSMGRSARFGRPPDQRTEYTNVNYILLGEIVERVSGEDLGTHITRNVLEPLGMKNTIYPVEDDLPGSLHGYHRDIARVKLVDTTTINPAPIAGAGAMISDVSDLKIWARALCTGKLLEPETHGARLQTRPVRGWPGHIEYGEGIVNAGGFCGHGGDLFGFNSQMLYLPQRDAVLVINVNRTDPYDEPAAEAITRDIIRILFPKYAANGW